LSLRYNMSDLNRRTFGSGSYLVGTGNRVMDLEAVYS
jgi:hypothetical protein